MKDTTSKKLSIKTISGKSWICFWMPLFFSFPFAAQTNARPEVRIWTESLTIPTYTAEKPDPNPRFYDGRRYQGAQGRVYPYPMSDVLTNQKEDKKYNAVYLENQYLKLCVLPEIGGRIFSAMYKTNNYDFFYRQQVIKPALIGMLGEWISGGVEWNFPHHHRANTFMPMDYVILENQDGSKTLWMSELEYRHRMRFLIGITLYPDKSYLEVTVKIFNPTPFVHSFLYWANPAVHVDETYQVIFPPQTQYVVQHAKNEFSEWPISNSRYGRRQYNNTDISWWKNLQKPVSFFCWDENADFFAGYNHGKNAGVVYVADHHVSPGKKFFTFGCGDEGKMWDKMLTDEDGPYLELMAGAYSDNQPDYSWIQPYEVKTVKQYWYPVRGTEGLKYANLNAALNLELTGDHSAQIRIHTTFACEMAEITLGSKENTLYQTTTVISPDLPFKTEVNLPPDTKEQDLLLTVRSGKTILAQYQPMPREETQPRPQPAIPPASPQKIKTNEELYLTGLRLDQFHNPKLDSYAYYDEALRRDPNDSQVNTQLGILYCKRGLFSKAEKHLNAAVGRLTNNYTRPKTAEAYYYLGVALKGQGKDLPAYDAFSRAAWDWAWHSASNYCMAELDCRSGHFEKALDHVQQAIAANTSNPKLLNLKTTLLRKLDKKDLARENAVTTLTIDPLDLWAQNELHQVNSDTPAEMPVQIVSSNIQICLETAVAYGNCGFYKEAIEILLPVKNKTSNPMVFYYLGYYSFLDSSIEQSRDYFNLAAQMPTEYCFPFRLESLDVLRTVITQNPGDGRAHYYLGNLWYDWEPENAIKHWQIACRLDQTNPTAFRNLALACWKSGNDISQAVAFMEKALSIDPDDPRLYYEMDILYEAARVPAETRLERLEKNSSIVSKRDEVLARKAALYLRTQNCEKAFTLLTTHHFNTWEGGEEIHDLYVDACLLYSRQKYLNNEFSRALELVQVALEYPDNLEVGRPLNDETAVKTLYWLGTLYETSNQPLKAQDCFKKAVSIEVEPDELLYYQALAFLKLGNTKEAQESFARLLEKADQILAQDKEEEFFAKFGEKQSQNEKTAQAHYLKGLGFLGQNKNNLAKEEFEKVIALDPYHIWAQIQLDDLQGQDNQVQTDFPMIQPILPRTIPHPLPDHPGNIFLDNEEVTIPLPANVSEEATDWQVADDTGKIISSGSIDKHASAFSIGKPGIGWYKIEFLDEQKNVIDFTTAAVLARLTHPTPQDSPVCLDAALAWLVKNDPRIQEQVANLAALAGVNWIRDRIHWGEIQPDTDTLAENTRYHTTADIQNQSGLKILQVYHDTPKWAVPENQNSHQFPEDLRFVYSSCRQFSQLFPGRVQAWEPWNEANAANFGGHTMAQMCSYQKAAYLGFKAGNPDMIVCWNPYGGVSTEHHTAGILENETGPYFDTYNIHSYDWPEGYIDIFAPARKAACGKPLWLTESDRGTKSVGNPPWYDLAPENNLLKAQFMAQSYASGLYAGVSQQFHFVLVNYTEGPDNQNKIQFGLLRKDLTPRPSYVALAAVGRFLAGAKCLGRYTLPDQPNTYVYAFKARPDGKDRDVLVAWAEVSGDWPDRGKYQTPWPLPTLQIEELFDYLGRSLGQTVPARLTSAPVFFVLPAGETAKLSLHKPPQYEYRPEKPSPVILQISMPYLVNIDQDPDKPWIIEPHYKISPNTETQIEFFAYNFSPEPLDGVIRLAKQPKGWKISPAQWKMHLEPMERKNFGMALTALVDSPDSEVSNWIKLQGDFSMAGQTALAFYVKAVAETAEP